MKNSLDAGRGMRVRDFSHSEVGTGFFYPISDSQFSDSPTD
jgi:hypothetical protein